MDNQRFKNSISSKRIQLNLYHTLTHYGIVFYLIVPIVIGLFYILKADYKDDEFYRSLYLILFPLPLVIIFCYIQYRRLRFTTYKTFLNTEQLNEVIKYVASRRNWTEITHAKNFYIATSYGGFLAGSWGERITILFDDDTIYFNSICDTDILSVTAWGRNYNHEKLFFKAVKLLEATLLSKNKATTTSSPPAHNTHQYLT